MSDKIQEMLEINQQQKAYYEVGTGYGTTRANNWSTNLFRTLKLRAFHAFGSSSKDRDVTELHRRWAGDLSGAKVLDLGCGTGNPLSVEFATAARQYTAIELSESRCSILRNKLAEAGVANPDVRSADFLSDEFPDHSFDLIYALSVFHHFRHFDDFLSIVRAKLAPGGRVIIYDPVAIWWPIRALRSVFRPWQTDAAWEYPFDQASLRAIERHFHVSDCRGLLGRSKWAAIVGVFLPSLGERLAQKWHEADMEQNKNFGDLRSCLHVTALLEPR